MLANPWPTYNTTLIDSFRALLEFGIYGCHIVWRIRNRKLLREAKKSGRSVDELLEERELEWQRQRERESSNGERLSGIDYDEEKSRPSTEARSVDGGFVREPAGWHRT